MMWKEKAMQQEERCRITGEYITELEDMAERLLTICRRQNDLLRQIGYTDEADAFEAEEAACTRKACREEGE